jgi:hypothetical protein
MTSTAHEAQLAVTVIASAEVVAAEVKDARPDAVHIFGELTERQREQLAHDAWAIGLRALANAHSQAQEARLQDVGTALLDDIDRQLKAHIETQQQTISSVLGRFFDPTEGQVTQRLTAFVDDQGVLARLLEHYLGPQNSVLAEALARQVGETSPLFKRLSPTDSEGLVKTLEEQLRKVMGEGHADLVRALDPVSEGGAVSRFLKSLREELKGADEDRAKQLAAALAALDGNDENSLINRLVRETHRARHAVLNAVNPDAPESPMAIMKTALTTLLKEHSTSQADLLLAQQERQERFEKEVREALTRMETKRHQDQKTPRGGLDFEQAVTEFVTAAVRGASCVVDVTGNSPGNVSRCKKGDVVIRFTTESAFDGSAVVFEAKRDASYTTQKALDELDAARKNREAAAGVFVMAKSHAPESFPRFSRYGHNVLITWDDRDSSTDAYLHAAVLLGLGLVTRKKTQGEEGDVNALHDIENRIEGEISRLDKMEKYNDSVRRNSDNIGDEIRKANKALGLLLRKAKSALTALNVELLEEDVERASPIDTGNRSFDEAVAALPRTNSSAVLAE